MGHAMLFSSFSSFITSQLFTSITLMRTLYSPGKGAVLKHVLLTAGFCQSHSGAWCVPGVKCTALLALQSCLLPPSGWVTKILCCELQFIPGFTLQLCIWLCGAATRSVGERCIWEKGFLYEHRGLSERGFLRKSPWNNPVSMRFLFRECWES